MTELITQSTDSWNAHLPLISQGQFLYSLLLYDFTTPAPRYNPVLAKIDVQSKNVVWQKNVRVDGDASVLGTACQDSDSIFLQGQYREYSVTYTSVVKINKTTGNIAWMRRIKTHAGYSPGVGIDMLSDGNLLVHCKVYGSRVFLWSVKISASDGETIGNIITEGYSGYNAHARISKRLTFSSHIFVALIADSNGVQNGCTLIEYNQTGAEQTKTRFVHPSGFLGHGTADMADDAAGLLYLSLALQTTGTASTATTTLIKLNAAVNIQWQYQINHPDASGDQSILGVVEKDGFVITVINMILSTGREVLIVKQSATDGSIVFSKRIALAGGDLIATSKLLLLQGKILLSVAQYFGGGKYDNISVFDIASLSDLTTDNGKLIEDSTAIISAGVLSTTTATTNTSTYGSSFNNVARSFNNTDNDDDDVVIEFAPEPELNIAILTPDIVPIGTAAGSPPFVSHPCHVRDGSILRNGDHDHGATCVLDYEIGILNPDATPIGTAAGFPPVVIDPCHLRDGSVLRDGIHDHGATCIPASLIAILDPDPVLIGTAAVFPPPVIDPCHLRDGSILRDGVHDHGATCVLDDSIGIINPEPDVLGTPASYTPAVARQEPPEQEDRVPPVITQTVLSRYGVAGSTGIDRTTGKPITGLAYLRDRMAGCLSMRLGTHPMRRLKGSGIPALIDAPLNKTTLFELQVAALDALSSVHNGFEDLTIIRAVVDSVSPGAVNFSVVFEQNDLPETVIAIEVML